jgi:hypothetical protein
MECFIDLASCDEQPCPPKPTCRAGKTVTIKIIFKKIASDIEIITLNAQFTVSRQKIT